MVTEAGRNNIIALAYIGGFAIVILTFFFNYVQQADKATQSAVYLVKLGVKNVTESQFTQTEVLVNLTNAVNKLIVLTMMDQNNTKANLAQFFTENQNQTLSIVKAIAEMRESIADLNKDSNASRAEQTKAFVNTLETSQNLSKVNQNLTQQRILIENATVGKLDTLLNYFNLSLIPQPPVNATITNATATTAQQIFEQYLKQQQQQQNNKTKAQSNTSSLVYIDPRTVKPSYL